jgi:hypothetical protein
VNSAARFLQCVVLATAVGVGCLLSGCGGSSTESARTVRSVRTVTVAVFTPFGPRAATPSELKTTSEILAQPVYWAGPKPGYTYEVRRGGNGDIFLRYLPRGTAVGAKVNKKAPFLIVATYPVSDAYGAIVRASKKKGSIAVKIPNKGLAVYAAKQPATYYFAYKHSKYQVGVFAPTTKVARRLVLGGQVVPVS